MLSRTTALLVAVLGIARVIAQERHQIPGFTYLGCFSVDLSLFGNPLVFSDGGLTPEVCQQACRGYQLAAVFQDCCRCGNNANGLSQVAESICDHSCMGNPAFGGCGSTCAKDVTSTGNVYGNNRPLPQDQGPVTIRIDNPLPSPSTSTTCTEDQVLPENSPVVTRSRQGQDPVTVRMTNTVTSTPPADTTCDEHKTPSANSPGITLVSPVGTAPNAPTTAPTDLALDSPSPPPSIPLSSQDHGATSTPPLDDYGKSIAPSPMTQAPQEMPTQDSQPLSYGQPSPDGLGPDPTSASSPPEYSPPEQPTQSVDNYPDPYSPNQEYNEPPSSTNCSSSLAPESVPSETTLWPKPSETGDPQGQPPVPSQVPGSYTTRTHVPPLTTVGGLAFLAAMIM